LEVRWGEQEGWRERRGGVHLMEDVDGLDKGFGIVEMCRDPMLVCGLDFAMNCVGLYRLCGDDPDC